MVTIRPEQSADIRAVRSVHEAAFPTANEADLVEKLRRSNKAVVSLVAEDKADGRIVGHIAFSPVTFDPPVDVLALGLAPMAVLPGHEKHGVGRRLVQNGLAECHSQGACLVVVLGDPGYYGRFGFERASRHGLRNEFGVEESFMVFMLDSHAHPPPGTVVKYADEFSALPKTQG
nr:acetyltransferase [uncultured bacterium]